MDFGIVVLTYEPCLALLRMPSDSYESPSEGRRVRVRSSAVGKAFRSERASGGQSECSDLVDPRDSGSGHHSLETTARRQHIRHWWRARALSRTVVVVVCLRRVPCLRTEGGAYNSVGRRACARNTIQALPRLEGSKAPIPSFPGSTFPPGAQGIVLEAVVDPNVLSYPVPIIMRERGEVVRRDETSLRTSGKARSVLGRRARWSLAFIPWARPSPALGGRARRSLALSPRARRS